MSFNLIKKLGSALLKRKNETAEGSPSNPPSKNNTAPPYRRPRRSKKNSSAAAKQGSDQSAAPAEAKPPAPAAGRNRRPRRPAGAQAGRAGAEQPRRRPAAGEPRTAAPAKERTAREPDANAARRPRRTADRRPPQADNRPPRGERRRRREDPLEPRPGQTRESPQPPTPVVAAEHGSWTLADFPVEPVADRKRFHDFDLPSEIMHAIADLGFHYCTPIQAASLEQALAGANVAGRAQTGTGKTAAFLVAILSRYLRSPDARADKPATPRALVLAPTRELCVQICNDSVALGKYCGLRSLAVFGGMDYAKQQRQLADGPVDLLAATPGRLLDFMRQRVVDLSRIDTLVIDEADRMLDMGFIPDVRRIIRSLPGREQRQTLLYSATLDDEVMRLATQWMPDPVRVEIEPDHVASDTIEQNVYIVTSDQKFTLLCNLLKEFREQRVLIFGNRRISTDRLAEQLTRQGFPCELLSGDVQQTRRMRVLDKFRSGEVKIVVATDVAGRGLHIADIGLVVNYELPYEAEDYVHRIGRTGRAGQIGRAVSFACEDESFQIPEIEKYLGEELRCVQPDEELLTPLPGGAGAPVWRHNRRAAGGRSDGRRRPPRNGGRTAAPRQRDAGRGSNPPPAATAAKESVADRKTPPRQEPEAPAAERPPKAAVVAERAREAAPPPPPPQCEAPPAAAPEPAAAAPRPVRAIPPPSARHHPDHARSQVWTPGQG